MSDLSVITAGVRVLVRVRPLLAKLGEDKQDSSHLKVHGDGNGQSVLVRDMDHNYSFNHVLSMSCEQEDVYRCNGIYDLVPHVMNGYNATIFAYGQTGAGKTYTMGGLQKSESSENSAPDPGVCIRLLHDLYSTASEGEKISVSFLQIYQEKVYDLLNQTAGLGTPLNVRWSSTKAFHVPELAVIPCEAVNQAISCYKKGNQKRVVAQHNLNTESSRSHTVFSVSVLKGGQTSVLTVVDLAGSEKVKQTGVQGATLTQAIGINQSLFVLRKVIKGQSTLEQQGNTQHIPYRDSVLTKLLKNSLGGNSLTTMIACINPQRVFAEETLNTLTYASQTAKIVNKAKPIEDEKSARIRQLQHENSKLREMQEKAKDLFLSKKDDVPSNISSTTTSGSTNHDKEDLSLLSTKLKQSLTMTSTLLQENILQSKEMARQQAQVYDSENSIVELEFDNIELQRQNQFLEELVLSGNTVDTASNNNHNHNMNSTEMEEIRRLRHLLTKQDAEIATLHKLYVQNRPKSNYNAQSIKRNATYHGTSNTTNTGIRHSSRTHTPKQVQQGYSLGPTVRNHHPHTNTSNTSYTHVVDHQDTRNPYLQNNQYHPQNTHNTPNPSSNSAQHIHMLQRMQLQMQQQQQQNAKYANSRTNT